MPIREDTRPGPSRAYYEQVLTDMRRELKRKQDELQSLKLALTLTAPFIIAAIGYSIISIFRSAI